MIDDAVLAAVAAAVDEGGDLERALALLGRADPLLRGSARRRLRLAHADARLATRLARGPASDPHALRLSYLLVARCLPPRAARDDIAAVAAAFAAARAARPPARAGWWPTALAALALVAAGGLAVAALRPAVTLGQPPRPLISGLPSPSPAVAEPPAPPAAGAFADGGAPAPSPGDAAVARALGVDAPAFLIALDRRSDARRSGTAADVAQAETEMRSARERALAADVREALGPGAAAALSALLTAASAASEVDAAPRAAADETLARAASTLDDELVARGLGYFVDGDVLTDAGTGRRLVLVYTFRVTRVSLFAAGDAAVRALWLRRLDKLNWSHTLLGFTRPTLRSAAVLLDPLDEQLVTLLAPALAEGAPMALFDPDAPASERAAVEARAGELAREEYGALPGVDRIAAAKLGKLLGKRRALLARWETLAAARGLTLVVPSRLRLPEGFARPLEGVVPRDELADLALIEAALDDRTRADAFAALRDALASSVERHEVQHRLDALRPPGAPLPMPPALAAHTGPLLDADGKERRQAAAARAELSAYLAELARDPHTPRVGLCLLARYLFDHRMDQGPERAAALTVLAGLGEALGSHARALLAPGGDVDRRAVAALWLELAALPPDRLREGARALWASLFSTPLPELRKLGPPG